MIDAAANRVGAGVLAALLAPVARMLPEASMASAAWFPAVVPAAACSALLWQPRFGPAQPRGWVLLAGSSGLLAAIFFGANGVPDALNGPRPSPIPSGGRLGGFKLRYALCPGLTSVAPAGWARSLCRRSGAALR